MEKLLDKQATTNNESQKDLKIIELKNTLENLKADFEQNLKLIYERDQELDEKESALQKMENQLIHKDNYITTLESKIKEVQIKVDQQVDRDREEQLDLSRSLNDVKDKLYQKDSLLLRNETQFKLELDGIKRDQEKKMSSQVDKIELIQKNQEDDLKDKMQKYNKLKDEKLWSERDLLMQVSQLKGEVDVLRENEQRREQTRTQEDSHSQSLLDKQRQSESTINERLRERESAYHELKAQYETIDNELKKNLALIQSIRTENKNRQEYILNQYETNIESMRKENLEEVNSIKCHQESSLNEIKGNLNSIRERQTALENKQNDNLHQLEQQKLKTTMDVKNATKDKHEELKTITKDLEKERQRSNLLQNEKLQLKSEVNQRCDEIVDFKQKLESVNSTKDIIINNLENKILEMERIQNELSSTQRSEENKLKTSYNAIKERYDELQSKNMNERDRCENMQQTLSEYKNNYLSLQSKNSIQMKEIQVANEEIKELNRRITQLEKKQIDPSFVFSSDTKVRKSKPSKYDLYVSEKSDKKQSNTSNLTQESTIESNNQNSYQNNHNESFNDKNVSKSSQSIEHSRFEIIGTEKIPSGQMNERVSNLKDSLKEFNRNLQESNITFQDLNNPQSQENTQGSKAQMLVVDDIPAIISPIPIAENNSMISNNNIPKSQSHSNLQTKHNNSNQNSSQQNSNHNNSHTQNYPPSHPDRQQLNQSRNENSMNRSRLRWIIDNKESLFDNSFTSDNDKCNFKTFGHGHSMDRCNSSFMTNEVNSNPRSLNNSTSNHNSTNGGLKSTKRMMLDEYLGSTNGVQHN